MILDYRPVVDPIRPVCCSFLYHHTVVALWIKFPSLLRLVFVFFFSFSFSCLTMEALFFSSFISRIPNNTPHQSLIPQSLTNRKKKSFLSLRPFRTFKSPTIICMAVISNTQAPFQLNSNTKRAHTFNSENAQNTSKHSFQVPNSHSS